MQKRIEPAKDYILPLGKADIALAADITLVKEGKTLCIITYGMGVYWASAAAKSFEGQVEIVDLRTLYPLDEAMVFASVKKHGKCIVLTEEQLNNSFAEALTARIYGACFTNLDAKIELIGSLNLPAVPMNVHLEQAMLPTAEKVKDKIASLLAY